MSRGPAYSILYSAPIVTTAAEGNEGDVLIESADSEQVGRYAKATTAERGSRRAAGVALSSYAAGGAVEIARGGAKIGSDTSGLSSGSEEWAVVSALGRLARCATADLAADADIIGKAHADGSVTLFPGTFTTEQAQATSAVADDIAKSAGTTIDRVVGIKGVALESGDSLGTGETWLKRNGSTLRAGKPVMPDHYNVVDYGADPTGATYSDAAFAAAIAAMGPAPTPGPGFTPAAWKGKVLFIPAGTYKLANRYDVIRSMIVRGVGGSGDYSQSVLVFDIGKSGIRFPSVNLDPSGGRGDFAELDGVAIFGGGSVPSFASTLRPSKWAASTAYTVGTIIVPSVVTAAGYALRCTVAGTSGETEPAWPTGVTSGSISIPTEGTTYADGAGALEWELIYANGIEVQSQFVKITNCQIQNFQGNGINVVASYAIGTLASLLNISHCRAHYNGGHGIFFAGDDSNAGMVARNDFSNNMGFGIHGRSFLNMLYLANHCAGNEGGAPIYATCGTFVDCYAEGGYGAIVLPNQSVTWVGGIAGAGTYDNFSDRYRTPWTANDTVGAHAVRRPTVDNGWYYKTTAGGTTGALTEPTWPVGAGKTVVDGTVTWVCYGLTEATTATVLGYGGRNLRAYSHRAADTLVSKMGADGTARYAFQWGHLNPSTDIEEHNYALEYTGRDWGFRSIGGSQYAAFLTTEASTGWSAYGAGFFVFSRGFILGGNGGYALTIAGTAPPASGSWLQGTYCRNTASAVGSPKGWYCTVSGTPGTWVSEGDL